MDPLVARDFEKLGFDKRSLIDWCAENAKMKAKFYWDDQWTTTLIKPHAVAGVEPFASRLAADPEEMISIFRPEDIEIIVAGGETQGAFKMISGRLSRPTRGSASSDQKGPLISIDQWR